MKENTRYNIQHHSQGWIDKAEKFIFLEVVGIVLFECAATYATARRGYDAVGGEYLLLFLPVIYAAAASVARDFAELFSRGKGR